MASLFKGYTPVVLYPEVMFFSVIVIDLYYSYVKTDQRS